MPPLVRLQVRCGRAHSTAKCGRNLRRVAWSSGAFARASGEAHNDFQFRVRHATRAPIRVVRGKCPRTKPTCRSAKGTSATRARTTRPETDPRHPDGSCSGRRTVNRSVCFSPGSVPLQVWRRRDDLNDGGNKPTSLMPPRPGRRIECCRHRTAPITCRITSALRDAIPH